MYNCKCAVRRYYSTDAGVARGGRQCINQMSRRSSRWRGHRSISAQVCELADHGLLGEGLLPTLREVFASGTAAKDAVVIPQSAYVEAALFEDASLAKRRGPDDYRRQRCKAVWKSNFGRPTPLKVPHRLGPNCLKIEKRPPT